MCHVWLSSSYKISCLGKSAYLSGNDTNLWMQSAETRCNGAIEESWHVVAFKATELLPWMSSLSLLANCQGYSRLYYPLGITPKNTDQSSVPSNRPNTRSPVPMGWIWMDPPPGCHTSPFAPAPNSLQNQDHPRSILCHPKTPLPLP